MDVDIGKVPEAHQLSPATEPPPIPTLDGWIENLMNCKQLAESDVVRLCDKVCEAGMVSEKRNPRCYELLRYALPRRGRYYRKNRMYSLW